MLKNVGDLLGVEARVYGPQKLSRQGHAEVRQEHRFRVKRKKSDTVPFLKPVAAQGRGKPTRARAEFLPGVSLLSINHRGSASVNHACPFQKMRWGQRLPVRGNRLYSHHRKIDSVVILARAFF